MAETDVSEAYVSQWLQSADDAFLYRAGSFVKEFYGFVDSQVKNVGDILASVCNIKHIAFVSLAVTRLTRYHKVGHELHRYGDSAFALTLFAASTIAVK